jgi:hypothetical protein
MKNVYKTNGMSLYIKLYINSIENNKLLLYLAYMLADESRMRAVSVTVSTDSN